MVELIKTIKTTFSDLNYDDNQIMKLISIAQKEREYFYQKDKDEKGNK